ncbi:MAG: hypothetical protein ACJAZY_001354 [Spirosomataceae bacterium]|jgi:hypothetical protein
MKKHFITLFSLFIISSATYGQRAATKTQKFDSKIENIVLDPATGIVYLKEDSKISAFSNELDKIVWTVDQDQIGANSALKALSNFDITAIGVDKDLLEVVEGSDYIYTVINDRNLVINGLTGDVVFNSERDLGEEIVMQQMFLPCDNAFLFLVRQKKDLKLKYFDLDTKKISWESEAGSQPSGLKATLSKDQALRQDRVESFENDLYALVNNKLLLIDKKSGKLNWVQEDINQFFICQNGANVVVIKNKGGMLSSKQIVNILNSGSGKFLWKKDIETRYVVSLQDWNDRVMIAHSSGFNMYDLKTGDKSWKKDVKGKNIKKVLSLGNNFLYVAEKDMILIDNDGKDKWKKDIEISDNDEDNVHYLGLTKNNKVLYITDTYGNMVDYENGEKLWKRNIKFNEKRPLLYVYDENKDVYLIYNDEELYKFDPNIDDKPEPFAKVKAKSDKTMSGIELFDWGVALTSQSEVIGVGLDGSTKFQNQYTQPGEGGRMALKVAGALGSAYLGTRGSAQNMGANAMTSMTYVDESGTQHTSTSYLFDDNTRNRLQNKANVNASASAALSGLTQNVANRFNALRQNSEYAFIFAKDESSDGKNKVLVKVSKKDGSEIDKIVVDNLKPLYDIDPVTNVIYYIVNNELRIFE